MLFDIIVSIIGVTICIIGVIGVFVHAIKFIKELDEPWQ